jgi:pimeloyl-ACP methyl ester carboxylesterase
MGASSTDGVERTGSLIRGSRKSGKSRRSVRRGAFVLAVGVAAAVLVGCSPDRPSDGEPHGAQSVQVPETPVGDQLTWVVSQLNGGADALVKTDVEAHFAPVFLQTFPPPMLIDLFRRTSDQAVAVSVTGFSSPLGRTQAIALIRAERPVDGSLRAAVYLNVEPGGANRITNLALSEPPGPSARELATPGPYTGAFDVGDGRTIFLSCAGSGSPTVILEAGAGGGANAWTLVQPEIAKVARVCSYDRANVPGGASDPAHKPRTAADVVADLHAALAAAGVPGPFVLVGHSDGGLFVRLYASLYPDEVAGLVLVDAVSENLEEAEAQLLEAFLTPEQLSEYRAAVEQQTNAPFVSRVEDEQVDISASSAELRAASENSPLQSMPLFVLTHGVSAPSAPGEPAALAREKERIWQQAQDELAALVPNAKHVVVQGSGHVIQQEQPEVVIDALRQVIEAVNDPGTW